MAQQAKDKKGNAVKFIRKNGKVIPIRSKGGAGGNPLSKKKKRGELTHKRKGARKDGGTGDYFTKSQRKKARKAKAFDKRQSAFVRKKTRKFQEGGLVAGTSLGAGAAVAMKKGSRGLIKGSIIGAAVGLVGGSLIGASKAKGARKEFNKKNSTGF